MGIHDLKLRGLGVRLDSNLNRHHVSGKESAVTTHAVVSQHAGWLVIACLIKYWREIVAVASLLVGIYGLRGMQTAKAAARAAKRKLLHIMAAKDFDELMQTSSK
jgi:hypothetical protein